VVVYYIYYLPWILVIASPIGLLLAANFTGITMARTNEVVAAKNAGISSFRIGVPVYIFGIIWSVVVLVFGEMVVPIAMQARTDIRDVKIFKVKTRLRAIADLMYNGENGETYLFRSYNPTTHNAHQVTITYFDDSLRISKRIDAQEMLWRNDRFELEKAYIRFFYAEGESVAYVDRMPLDIPERPHDFERLRVNPDEMGFFDLWRFIRKAERSGRDPAREKTDLLVKVIFPFSNLIILLFSLPLALRLRRSGAALGFGISFIVAFIYFALVRIGQSLGYNETLSPFWAASLGNLIFGFIGVNMLYFFRD